MNPTHNDRPSPADHKEIARGSGPAAILLFLHIAVTGYLGSVIYLLLKDNVAVFWTLVPFSAGLFYYFPAAFALFTSMPTNPLTRTVARVAQVAGVLALLTFGAGLVAQALHNNNNAINPGLQTACAIAAGIAGALLLRVLFRLGIGHPAEIAKKADA
jgi:hypothetical protein